MDRPYFLESIAMQLAVHPICALLGPRQVGKTTLAKMYGSQQKEKPVRFFDLENPLDLAVLENPMLAFSRLSNHLIIIDEIQRRPELFPMLRVLADQTEKQNSFLILGSASRDLIQQSSETLAGRIGYIELTPFSLKELAAHNSDNLWLCGGFPKAYLAANPKQSYIWRQAYIKTFLERDIPQLGFQIPAAQMHRFWLMLAHCHGQIFNASELGRSLGISDHTVKKYIDILVGTFMIRRLAPWHANLNKRQVKSPKIYFRDSGLLNALLGIQDMPSLETSPKLGSLWEGFALEEVIRLFCDSAMDACYFWHTQAGAELDLLIFHNGKRLGFEFKYSDAPRATRSMHIAIEDLQLDHLMVVFPGERSFIISEHITAVGINDLTQAQRL